jgi:hypothetical protein
MPKLSIAGITSIDCPSCGHKLRDYDPLMPLKGLMRVAARCHVCHADLEFEIDTWRGETQVWAVKNLAPVPD